jgi:hypothetical protein
MTFEDDLKAPIERDWTTVDIVVNGNLHTLRFEAMDGYTWANECDKCPMRDDVPLDGAYGYDLRKLTFSVAPLCGSRVEDTNISMDAEQWKTLLDRVDGQTFRRISDAIWALNELLPQEAVKEAKKALAVSVQGSPPPSSSASPQDDSSAGNQEKSSSTSTKTGS